MRSKWLPSNVMVLLCDILIATLYIMLCYVVMLLLCYAISLNSFYRLQIKNLLHC